MATYYVATNGSNTANNGTSAATPWATVAYAVEINRTNPTRANLQPGDTVIVAAGTYTGTVDVQVRGSSGGGYITIKSAVKHGAKINGNGAANALKIMGNLSNPKRYIRVEGFEVYNADCGLNADLAHHIEYVDNFVHDIGGNGLYMRRCEFLLVEGNTVTTCTNLIGKTANALTVQYMENISGTGGTPDDHLDAAPAWRCIVRNNFFYENGLVQPTNTDGGAIMIDSGHNDAFTPPTTYLYPRLVENNVCIRNGGPGIIVLEVPNTLVRGNTCYRNGLKANAKDGWTASLMCRSDDVTFVNNIAVIDDTFVSSDPAETGAVAIGCCALTNRPTRTPAVDVPGGYTTTTFTGVKWYNNLSFNIDTPASTSLFAANQSTSSTSNTKNLPTAGSTDVHSGKDNLLATDPKFIAMAGDRTLPAHFQLASDSPCINGGSTTAAHRGTPTDDYEGTTRTGTMDIGAFNYTAPVAGGIMAANSTIATAIWSRGAQANINSAVETGDLIEIGGTYTERTSRSTPAPACWIGDTGSTVQDTAPSETKTLDTAHQGAIVVRFSMKPD